MKIAISSNSQDEQGQVSEFFGRAPYFLIFEVEDKQIKNIEILENEVREQSSGVGISASQLLAEKDVKAIISGNIGPRALDVLKQFQIQAYIGQGIVKDVLQNFIEDKLKKIE